MGRLLKYTDRRELERRCSRENAPRLLLLASFDFPSCVSMHVASTALLAGNSVVWIGERDLHDVSGGVRI